MKVKIGFETAMAYQQFETLSKVVALAFGGDDKKGGKAVQSASEASHKLTDIFGEGVVNSLE